MGGCPRHRRAQRSQDRSKESHRGVKKFHQIRCGRAAAVPPRHPFTDEPRRRAEFTDYIAADPEEAEGVGPEDEIVYMEMLWVIWKVKDYKPLMAI
uniref:Uncharacterized protein n=1 Tax=Leersia perrieri TaxID=77586 RepID=A0A0D9VVT2_9ORYZ